MNGHEPQSADFKSILSFNPYDPKPTRMLYRIPCSCEWVGSWFSDLDHARDSFDKHVQNIYPGPREAAWHVVGCICSECDTFVYEAL